MPKELFRCEFCNRELNKKEAKEHERLCMRNPANKTCATCQYRQFNHLSFCFGDNSSCAEGFEMWAYAFCKSWKLTKGN